MTYHKVTEAIEKLSMQHRVDIGLVIAFYTFFKRFPLLE